MPTDSHVIPWMVTGFTVVPTYLHTLRHIILGQVEVGLGRQLCETFIPYCVSTGQIPPSVN